MLRSTFMAAADRGTLLYLSSVALAAVLGLQCATGSPGPRVRPGFGEATVGWSLPAEALGTQRLFRVHYEGQGGRGGMKLVLRLHSESEFQVSTTDALGRSLWSLQTGEMATILIDHRRREYCEARDFRLPDPVLEEMPWPSLPRVLLGFFPAEPEMIESSSEHEVDYRGSDGRRWTGRLEGGRASSWVLWDDSRPVLWWRRQGDGGLLSHREGIQIRWREIVNEPLQSPFVDLQIPAGYRPSECRAVDLP